MDFRLSGERRDEIVFLDRREVIACSAEVDFAATVADAMRAHASGKAVIPPEAYLGWTTAEGDAARCLAMPGAFLDVGVIGLKVINGSLGNSRHGLARSQGLTMLFDPMTARPVALLEAAYISAMRTAFLTAVTAHAICPPELDTVAVIGCGEIGRAHLFALSQQLPALRRVSLYDMARAQADLAAGYFRSVAGPELSVRVCASAREAFAGAGLVAATTTVTTGYIEPGWLEPGALLALVSLDDALPETVLSADILLVDDWDLVCEDEHRLLGRMHRQGLIASPTAEGSDARRVDATLGQVLAGQHPGRKHPDDVVLSNPFGMSILDLAIADQVTAVALKRGLGQRIVL